MTGLVFPSSHLTGRVQDTFDTVSMTVKLSRATLIGRHSRTELVDRAVGLRKSNN